MRSVLRTIIIDSEPEARTTLRRILASTPSVVVVNEYTDLTEATIEAPSRRPDLVFVEIPSSEEARGVRAIQDLSNALPETAIVATGPSHSADFVIQVIRAGAVEFLSRPIDRVDVIAALDKLTRFRRGSSAPRISGQVISVFSLKGGLGVTTVATNLAVCLAEQKPDATLLIDMDTRQSEVATFLNLKPTYSVLDAFENIERMDESFLRGLLVKHKSDLWVLAGPPRIERAVMTSEQIQAGLEIMRSHFRYVVLDLRHDLDLGTLAALEMSDTILFLTGPTVSAVRSAAQGIAALKQAGISAQKVKIAVMRLDSGQDVTVKHIRDSLGVPIFWTAPSDYWPVVSAINNGEPVVTSAPKSKFSRSLVELTGLVTKGDKRGAEPAEKPALLRRLVRAPWSSGA